MSTSHSATTGLALLTVSGLGGAVVGTNAQRFISRFLERLGFLAVIVAAPALATGVSRSGRWESALWVMVGVNVLMMALALLVRRQGKLVVV